MWTPSDVQVGLASTVHACCVRNVHHIRCMAVILEKVCGYSHTVYATYVAGSIEIVCTNIACTPHTGL
jgi:hypothetical protein